MAFTSAPNQRLPIGAGDAAGYAPFGWLRHYHRSDLSGDLLAGLVVAVMLVPQSMAYAMLAGLPPQTGLYAAMLPLFVYGLLGSSRVLSVGPAAIDSLLVAAAIMPLAAAGGPQYLGLALTLAFLVGLIELLMGLLRLGFLVSFISQPVLVGFVNAAALVIAVSQLKTLLGIPIPSSEKFLTQAGMLLTHLDGINWATVAISLLSLAILFTFKKLLGPQLRRAGLGETASLMITRSAPLLVVLLTTAAVAIFHLDVRYGVKIVGAVPAGLPALTAPSLDLTTLRTLMPAALAIAAVGYMEAISTAKSLARKRRERIHSNQELLALGAANLSASFTGGYVVTGGLARSAVNADAGVRTGVASMTTALLVALTALLLTPLFRQLPTAALSAIIFAAVLTLVDVATPRFVFRYSRADAAAMAATFLAVLLLGVADGILVGAALSLLLYIARTSRPHVAIVGRMGESELYRNVLRHKVTTWPTVVLLRVDESLYFANVGVLADVIMAQAADNPDIREIVLICVAINSIDASALETVRTLVDDLRRVHVDVHLTDVKGPVMDKLEAIGFVEQIGRDHIHLSAHEAMQVLGYLDQPKVSLSPSFDVAQQVAKA